MIKSYKDLIVWQKSIDLAVEIFELTKKFPREELFGLAAQMRRTAFSIQSNIAEGYSRNTQLDYGYFLRISYASGAELETQLILSLKVKLINSDEFDKENSLLNEILRMLNSLLRKIKSSKKTS